MIHAFQHKCNKATAKWNGKSTGQRIGTFSRCRKMIDSAELSTKNLENTNIRPGKEIRGGV